MNASELYEIVKDVDRAAWPEKIRHTANLFAYMHEGGDKFMPTSLMEAAFVGSMVAWLIGKGYHVHGWDSNSDTSTATLVLYDREFSVSTDKYRGMGTIVALLAAACKEARP